MGESVGAGAGRPLKFAVFGAGFWSWYQVKAWQEFEGVEPVALYNRTRSKGEKVAASLGIPRVYDDARALFDKEQLDFVDIITAVETHAPLVRLAAERRVPVICQKPMAPTLAEAQGMVDACREAGVPLFIHENWRWQAPIRRLKAELDRKTAGAPFRARIHYCSSFPVFDNQPFLKEIEQFILMDMGSHIFDVARFLFGEARSVYCLTKRIHKDIKGEDVATVMLEMERADVVLEISYASRTERERFPETFIFVECDAGSVELALDYWLRVTTADGTHARRVPPPRYAWADPAYDTVHASIVAANESFLRYFREGKTPETTGEDNLETMKLVFAAYESAASGKAIRFE